MYTTIRHIIAFTILASVLLSGCNTIQRIQAGELTTDFDQTFRQYSKHLRWGHFRELTAFMTADHIAPAMVQAGSLKDIKISSVKPTAWILDKDAGIMTGDVMVDYYITTRGVIRSTTQHQTWRYQNEKWKLDNGLPDLR